MADIRHRVGIAAPATQVYASLTTREGLAGWWTHDVRGEANVGSTLRFHFGGEDARTAMEVVEQIPHERVVWRCVGGPDEWIGTALTFDLAASEDETVVLFTHAGWREPVEFLHHCSTKWAYFLLGLKAGLENGMATPFPNDSKISGWG